MDSAKGLVRVIWGILRSVGFRVGKVPSDEWPGPSVPRWKTEQKNKLMI